MRFKALKRKIALATLLILQSILPPAADAGDVFGRIKRLITESEYKGTEPAMGQDGAMECLAENIDWLEHHIDTYGSIVAKQPDIWGEARLTKHRDEYERIMFGELGEFDATINAAIRQQDGSFLAQAFALSAAAGAPGVAEAPAAGSPPASVQVGSVTATLPGSPTFNGTDWTKFGISGTPTDPGIKLEPVLFLDQQSRYLKHLHELRRINEGDDTSDSPGYSLNLVRIPVSLLPGKLTRQGFGAEITITAEPVISDDLMPTTFRNLVVNDLVHLLGLPLVRVTENLKQERQLEEQKPGMERLIEEAEKEYETALAEYKQAEEEEEKSSIAGIAAQEAAKKKSASVDQLTQAFKSQIASIRPAEDNIISELRSLENGSRAFSEVAPSLQRSGIETAKINSLTELSEKVERAQAEANDAAASAKVANQIWISDKEELDEKSTKRDEAKQRLVAAETRLNEAQERLSAAEKAVAGVASPAGRSRQARNPLNPSSMDKVIGTINIKVVARFFESTYYGRYIRWSGGNESQECNEQRVNLLDARKFLDAEIQAAFELLSQEDHVCLLAELAEPNSGLAAAIRSGHFDGSDCTVQKYRHYFFDQLHNHQGAGDRTDSLDRSQRPMSGYNEIEDLSVPDAEPEAFSKIHVSLSDFIRGSKCCPDDFGNTLTTSDSICAEASNPLEALAWAIVVESALLNERLNLDVRKLAQAKDAYSLNTTEDHWFFLPDTASAYDHIESDGVHELMPRDAACRSLTCSRISVEYQAANEVFKEYVRVRWPIHVFAVDPVSQDQNVADVSQRKRELQFALALGFQTGQIGANSLTQFSRQLQTQIETISLNRTIVGFGHGADTFGWRFYPRVQALDTPGTLGAIRETLLGTSRDYDLRHRQIEAGQRECVAVVLMPSFVPYADFDIRTNWFKLTNPRNSALTMKDSLKFSRAITAMRNSRATCAQCQHLYRDGELQRLFKRVDQLDRELPMQTQRSMVPYENTLGGFEMFNTGVTDLAPELIGWYGAPGINTVENACGCYHGCSQIVKDGCTDAGTCQTLGTTLEALNAARAKSPVPPCEGPGTTLFLVGDNFSVHDTRVIAGGICIPQVRLISRELMQVTIPHCINTVELCENGTTNKYVAIYIATPYGVTNHLHVPVVPDEGCGGDCSSSVVRQNAEGIDVSTTSVLLEEDIQGHVGRGNRMPEFRTASVVNIEAPVRLAAQIEAEAQVEASTLANGILNLSEQLERLNADVQALAALRNQSLLDIRVSSPNAMDARAGHNWFDSKDFPLLHRFKVKAGEQWRNCRDNLPCN